MATITFKTKVKEFWNVDGSSDGKYVNIPEFTRAHCDMAEFRRHPRFGGIANSTLFPNALKRIRRDVLRSDYRGYVRLSDIPENMNIDTSGFLAVVTITI